MKYLFFVYIILCLPGFSYAQENELTGSKLLDAREDTILFQIGGIELSEKGTLIVSDQMIYKIRLFDNSGVFLKEKGRRGRGPGEFEYGPAHISASPSSKEIAVLDLTTPFINIFDENLNFVDQITNQYPVSDLIYDYDGNLIVSSPPTSDYIESVVIYSSDKEILNSFSPDLNFKNSVFDIFYINYLPSSDKLILAYQFRNLIQIYNYEGELIEEIIIENVPEFAHTKEVNYGRIKELPEDNIFNDITVDKNFIYVLIGAYSNKPDQRIYVFNHEGKQVNTIDIEYPASSIRIFQNTIYAVNKDKTQILKYKIK